MALPGREVAFSMTTGVLGAPWSSAGTFSIAFAAAMPALTRPSSA